MKVSGKKDDELRKVIKERIAEKKRYELEIKTTIDTLRKLENSYYQFRDAVRKAKKTLGGRKGGTCPALKGAKRTYGGVEEVVCKAKRYKYRCWSEEEMYRQHCFACHLTPEQAKTGMLYDRILIGRREDGQ